MRSGGCSRTCSEGESGRGGWAKLAEVEKVGTTTASVSNQAERIPSLPFNAETPAVPLSHSGNSEYGQAVPGPARPPAIEPRRCSPLMRQCCVQSGAVVRLNCQETFLWNSHLGIGWLFLG